MVIKQIEAAMVKSNSFSFLVIVEMHFYIFKTSIVDLNFAFVSSGNSLHILQPWYRIDQF